MKGAFAFQSIGNISEHQQSWGLACPPTTDFMVLGRGSQYTVDCLFIQFTMAAAFLGAVWGLRSKYWQHHCTKRKTAVLLLFPQVWLRLMKTKKKNPGEWLHWKPKRFICLPWKRYLERCFLLVQTHIGRTREGGGGEPGRDRREEEEGGGSYLEQHTSITQ